MDAALRRMVWQRAHGRCEYCRIPEAADDAPFEIDHVISRKHAGPTSASNLCLSCYYCNSSKGSDISSLDRKTRKLSPLFNPRRHKWTAHFRWDGPYLIGRTAIGRVSVALLRINDDLRVELRKELIAEGLF
jgi:hypothetical protein